MLVGEGQARGHISLKRGRNRCRVRYSNGKLNSRLLRLLPTVFTASFHLLARLWPRISARRAEPRVLYADRPAALREVCAALCAAPSAAPVPWSGLRHPWAREAWLELQKPMRLIREGKGSSGATPVPRHQSCSPLQNVC